MSEATSKRPKGSVSMTTRLGPDETRALDIVQKRASENSGRAVTRSQALRLALRAAVLDAERAADAMGVIPRVTPDQMAAATSALRDAEIAYRGFDAQVQQLGNSVNQLAIVATRGGPVDPYAIARVERLLAQVLTEMRTWERFDNRERQRLTWDM